MQAKLNMIAYVAAGMAGMALVVLTARAFGLL